MYVERSNWVISCALSFLNTPDHLPNPVHFHSAVHVPTVFFSILLGITLVDRLYYHFNRVTLEESPNWCFAPGFPPPIRFVDNPVLGQSFWITALIRALPFSETFGLGCRPGREQRTFSLTFRTLLRVIQPACLLWWIFCSSPGGLPSMGSQRLRHDWSNLAAAAAAAPFKLATCWFATHALAFPTFDFFLLPRMLLFPLYTSWNPFFFF